MSAAKSLAKVIRRRYEMTGSPSRYPSEDSLAEFILENAASVGLAVIELPVSNDIPPEYNDGAPGSVTCIGRWVVPGDEITAWTDGLVTDDLGGEHTPAVMRQFAAALLAAAAAVEAVQS